MITRRLAASVAAVLLLSAMTVGASVAGSDTWAACGEQLAQLHDDVLSMPITDGKIDKERAGLVKLVEDAAALVDAGRTADAVVKLANLQTKVEQLVAAGRVTTESGTLLTGDIVVATECLATV